MSPLSEKNTTPKQDTTEIFKPKGVRQGTDGAHTVCVLVGIIILP